MIPKSDIENWVAHYAGTKGSSGNNAIVREIERLRAALQFVLPWLDDDLSPQKDSDGKWMTVDHAIYFVKP